MSEWEGCGGWVCIAGVSVVKSLGKASSGYKTPRIPRNLAQLYQGLWAQWQGGGRRKLQRK